MTSVAKVFATYLSVFPELQAPDEASRWDSNIIFFFLGGGGGGLGRLEAGVRYPMGLKRRRRGLAGNKTSVLSPLSADFPLSSGTEGTK